MHPQGERTKEHPVALVITRRPGEAIVVRCDGWTQRIYVISIEGNVVRLAIEAPPDQKILREELIDGDPPPPKRRRWRDALVVALALLPVLGVRACKPF